LTNTGNAASRDTHPLANTQTLHLRWPFVEYVWYFCIPKLV